MKKSAIALSLAISMTAINPLFAANEVFTTLHGSACQATSLGQATNLNAKWSAKGTSNPNTVASGQSFFVVCPMQLTGLNDVTSETPNLGIGSVHNALVTYQDLTTSVAECTFRRYNYNGELLKSVTGVPASASPQAAENFIQAADLIDPADGALLYGGDTVSVVCALNPQTTITGISHFAPANPPAP